MRVEIIILFIHFPSKQNRAFSIIFFFGEEVRIIFYSEILYSELGNLPIPKAIELLHTTKFGKLIELSDEKESPFRRSTTFEANTQKGSSNSTNKPCTLTPMAHFG